MIKLLNKLCLEEELTIDKLINNLALLFSQTKIIKKISYVKQHYDEPQFFHFSAKINSHYLKSDSKEFSTRASGFSFFSQKTAFLKCCGEAIERYCNHVFFRKYVKYIGPYSRIVGKAINLQSIASFSDKQKENNSTLKFDENSEFCWSEGQSLLTNKKLLIPCQLIYLSYPRLRNEPIIYLAISTGAAGGGCLSAAINRGIYEIVERDSYIIHYLNKISSPRIDLQNIKNDKIQHLLKIGKRYKLEIVTIDTTSNLDISSYASIVIDKSGIGKAVSVGLKANLNKISAIIGSIDEAFHSRPWMRREYEKRGGKIDWIKLEKIHTLIERGLLWYPKSAIEKIDFWLKNKRKVNIDEKQKHLSSGLQLKKLIKIFKQHSYDVLFVDLTPPQFRQLGYNVVKVIIPQLQPIYLSENYRCFGGERLYKVPQKLGCKIKKEKELNQYPHPFL